MLVLITGAAHPLAAEVAQALTVSGHTVRATDRVAAATTAAVTAANADALQRDYRQGDLTDPAFAAGLLTGVSGIVHLAPLALVHHMRAAPPGEMLDAATRGTHVLLKAAVGGTRPVVVIGSTLAVMDAYGEHLEVTEQWRPRPQPEAAHLAPYLSELVAREFTRDPQLDDPLRIACLRFAPLGQGPDQVAPTLAAQVVLRAIEMLQGGARQRGYRWHLYHVASPAPDARYPSTTAQRALGYAGEIAAPGGRA